VEKRIKCVQIFDRFFFKCSHCIILQLDLNSGGA
jgi:hypothetical protein